MNEDILGLLGVDVKGAKEKAFARGLLSTVFNAAQMAGPQRTPISNVQALGQLGLGAMQAYDTSFDQTLKEALTGFQVKDLIEKRQREKQLQALLPQVFKTTRAPGTEIPTELGATGDLGAYTPVIEPGKVTGVQLDPQKLQALMMIPGGAEAVRGIAETQKLMRQAGLGVGGQMQSPLDIFASAQNPRVVELAANYKKSYEAGMLDENQLNRAISELGRMEDNYVTRIMASEERAGLREEAKAQRAEERATPKPDEQKQITGADNTISAIKAFKDKLTGFGRTDVLSPTQRSEIQTLYRNMLLQAKEAYNLGVLNGPDLMIMEQIVQDPTSLKGLVIGGRAISRQADELDRIMNTIKSNVETNVKARGGSQSVSVPDLRSMARKELENRKGK